MYGQILCICLHANEGRKSKTSFVTVLICGEIFFFYQKYSAISRDPFYGFNLPKLREDLCKNRSACSRINTVINLSLAIMSRLLRLQAEQCNGCLYLDCHYIIAECS